MPMIELTATAGTLTGAGRETVQRDLASALLRWEGAPDIEFFRAAAWTYLHELPAGAQVTVADSVPRFRVDVRVPAGALNDAAKEGLVGEATEIVLAAAGLTAADAGRVWVLIHEMPDGNWGAGGKIVRIADLAAVAKAGTQPVGR